MKAKPGTKNFTYLPYAQIENHILEFLYHLPFCDVTQITAIFRTVGIFGNEPFKNFACL